MAVFSVLFQGKKNCTDMCGKALIEEATFDMHITVLANTNEGHKTQHCGM
jgi:hypothetical protein